MSIRSDILFENSLQRVNWGKKGKYKYAGNPMEEINFVQMYPSLNSHPLGVTLGILIYQPYQPFCSLIILS